MIIGNKQKFDTSARKCKQTKLGMSSKCYCDYGFRQIIFRRTDILYIGIL